MKMNKEEDYCSNSELASECIETAGIGCGVAVDENTKLIVCLDGC